MENSFKFQVINVQVVQGLLNIVPNKFKSKKNEAQIFKLTTTNSFTVK